MHRRRSKSLGFVKSNCYVNRFDIGRRKAHVFMSDLTRIIMGTNEMPQRRLGWCTSWELTESKLQ